MADTAYDRWRGRLEGRESAGQLVARCPAHEDRQPSLSVRPIEGMVLVNCHAGCATEDVVAALGWKMADLYDEPKGATYTYSSGRVVHRTPDKKFRQSGDKSTVELYRVERLPEPGARMVVLVEGEKDVLAVESLGGIAVTAPMGATNFHKVNVEPLRGHHVTAVVDRDEAGQQWAGVVARKLAGVAKSVWFVQAIVGKDAADHIAAGHALGDFEPIEPVAATAEPGRVLVAVAASEMSMRAPTWLYDRRVPTGAITLLAGREGIGKSTISYDLVARITLGTLPGIHEGKPRAVAVVAGEDAWDCVILPRLVAAGADRTRVFRVEARTEDGLYDAVSVPADLDRLAVVCAEKDAALVVIDPVMSVIHGSLDTHKDRDVRQALDPLARFAATTGVAVLGLIHTNKSSTSDPLNSVMASRAFSAVARSVLYCIVDPDAEQDDRYLFGHPKSNLGPRQPTLRYHLVEVKLELTDGEETVIVTSRVVWDGLDERTIRDAMEAPRAERAAGELANRLTAWIEAQGRTVSAAEIAAAHPDVNRARLDQNLTRLVKRDKIMRPMYGHYVSPSTSDNNSDTSLETSEASVQSVVSDDQDELTGLTQLTDLRVSERLSDRASELPGWAADAYDREA